MKITNAWIEDPTLVGVLEAPVLHIETDSIPDVSIEPEQFAGGWTVGKYGPFVHFTSPGDETAGDYNVRFRNRFPVVVDVTVTMMDGPADVVRTDWSLPLTRARQLLRKFDPSWRMVVDERAAEAGRLLWTARQLQPSCRHWTGTAICAERPARTVRANGVDLPLCDFHVTRHNDAQAQRRAARTA